MKSPTWSVVSTWFRTPFWYFVIQYQTCTATTAGIAQARTSPAVSRMRTGVEADKQQGDREAEHDGQADVAAVKATVRTRVSQEIWSSSTER